MRWYDAAYASKGVVWCLRGRRPGVHWRRPTICSAPPRQPHAETPHTLLNKISIFVFMALRPTNCKGWVGGERKCHSNNWTC